MLIKIRNVLIVFLCAIGVFLLISQWRTFYLLRFEAYEVYANFEDREVAITQFHQLMNYLAPGSNQNLDSEFFSPEDILHMQDVRVLYNLMYTCLTVITILLLIVTALTSRSKLEVKGSSIRSAYLVLVIGLMILGIAAYLVWEPLFDMFHRIVFPYNNYWQLDPASSNLIRYFLNPIFQEIFLLNVLVHLGIFGIIALWTNKDPS